MERITLSDGTLGKAVEHATAVLKRGGVILFPTDTLYGLGADAFCDRAVDAVYRVKERNEGNPVHCIVADLAMAEEYADLTDDARLLAQDFFPGPLTLVLKKHPDLDRGIGRDLRTIGIRIPDNEFCLSLASALGKPFTATSANRSGEKPMRTVGAILEQLGATADEIDLSIDAGQLSPRQPSTVVDLSGESPVILREGAVPAADVWNVLRTEP